MHTVRMKWEDIQTGSDVKIQGIDLVCQVIEKKHGLLVVKCGKIIVGVSFSIYEHSYTESPDLMRQTDVSLCAETWTACEKHYGISHYGSKDPDPLRKLAFELLQGDK